MSQSLDFIITPLPKSFVYKNRIRNFLTHELFKTSAYGILSLTSFGLFDYVNSTKNYFDNVGITSHDTILSLISGAVATVGVVFGAAAYKNFSDWVESRKPKPSWYGFDDDEGL